MIFSERDTLNKVYMLLVKYNILLLYVNFDLSFRQFGWPQRTGTLGV